MKYCRKQIEYFHDLTSKDFVLENKISTDYFKKFHRGNADEMFQVANTDSMQLCGIPHHCSNLKARRGKENAGNITRKTKLRNSSPLTKIIVQTNKRYVKNSARCENRGEAISSFAA